MTSPSKQLKPIIKQCYQCLVNRPTAQVAYNAYAIPDRTLTTNPIQFNQSTLAVRQISHITPCWRIISTCAIMLLNPPMSENPSNPSPPVLIRVPIILMWPQSSHHITRISSISRVSRVPGISHLYIWRLVAWVARASWRRWSTVIVPAHWSVAPTRHISRVSRRSRAWGRSIARVRL